jgi:hypothetical protein
VRCRVALLLIALGLAGAATAAVPGSGNPTGQWATPRAVQTVILSHRLGVGQCSGGVCKIGLPANKPGVVAESAAKVVSVTVGGIGPYKLINGVRRYQLFNVRACTLYYYRGAHRFGVHFRWFTRRPPGGTTTSIDRGGTISVGQDRGEPYARDWNYPLFGPLADGHC